MFIVHILILSANEPLWQMERKKVKDLSTNKEFYQFKFACVSYLNLKQKKAFKKKVDKCLSTQFYGKTSAYFRKTLKCDSAHAIALIMLYENSKSPIFKVLGVAVYCFIEKYVCVDYLCFQREAKL